MPKRKLMSINRIRLEFKGASCIIKSVDVEN